MVSKENWYL